MCLLIFFFPFGFCSVFEIFFYAMSGSNFHILCSGVHLHFQLVTHLQWCLQFLFQWLRYVSSFGSTTILCLLLIMWCIASLNYNSFGLWSMLVSSFNMYLGPNVSSKELLESDNYLYIAVNWRIQGCIKIGNCHSSSCLCFEPGYWLAGELVRNLVTVLYGIVYVTMACIILASWV